jgi:site-specific DNA recombinase
MRLDGYVRVSRVAGREGDSFISPQVQRDRIAAWASVQGHDVVAWHEDLDQSGGRANRPGLNATLERLERGETDGLIVARLDRFFRSALDAGLVIRRIEQSGGQLVSVADNLDTSTPTGRFARSMMLLIAELQLETIRGSWEDTRREAIGRGVHWGSISPVGYTKSESGRLEVNPQTGPAVAEAFGAYAAGGSVRTASLVLERAGVPTPHGSPKWGASSTVRVLRNRVYLGEARSGEIVNRSAHDPIVDPATFAAAQVSRGGLRPAVGHVRLLAGMVRCGSCARCCKAVVVGMRGGSKPGYRCARNHAAGACDAPVSSLASTIDDYVVGVFLDYVANRVRAPDVVLVDAALTAAEQVAREAESDLVTYRDDPAIIAALGARYYADGLVLRKQRLEEALDRVSDARQRAAVSASQPSADLLDAWPTLAPADRRAIIAATIDAVVLHRAAHRGRHGPIDERVEILWRGEAPELSVRHRGRVRFGPIERSAVAVT